MRHNLILALVTSLICVILVSVAGEIYVRKFSRWGYSTPEILRNRGFHYVPSVFTQFLIAREEKFIDLESYKNATYTINRHGYRGEDFEFEKPEGVIRVIAYGGSSTFDTGMTDPDDWPHRLQRLLSERGFENVEVINGGTPGHTSFDTYGKLFTEGHLMKPDIVMMYNAWNDIKYFHVTDPYLRVVEVFREGHDPRYYYQNRFDQWLSERSQFYVRLRQRYWMWRVGHVPEGAPPTGEVQPAAGSIGLRQYGLDVDMFVRLAQQIGAVPVLIKQARLPTMDNTEEERALIEYNYVRLTHEGLVHAYAAIDSIIDDVASRTGAVVIDASTPLTGRGEYFIDHVHLQPEGSHMLAELVADGLAPVIARRQAEASGREK